MILYEMKEILDIRRKQELKYLRACMHHKDPPKERPRFIRIKRFVFSKYKPVYRLLYILLYSKVESKRNGSKLKLFCVQVSSVMSVKLQMGKLEIYYECDSNPAVTSLYSYIIRGEMQRYKQYLPWLLWLRAPEMNIKLHTIASNLH